MKWKQVFFIIAVSAASAIGSVALYNKFSTNKADYIGTAQNGLPANYAGYFEGKKFSPAEPVDLTKAASAAVPAVVHIKTKIPAKKVSNDLPRRRSNLDEFFGDM
ncbi:MAG: serine protease, partial [Bacteroidota bacterium]|nr:serine protease [Bacteroidota bacterium]